jgi:uncharacterized membrane-anchored protein
MHNHALRTELHNEVHTRPRPPVSAPQVISHLSVLHHKRHERPKPARLIAWCARHDLNPPESGQSHFDAQLGTLRIKWERHGEFDDFTVYTKDCDPLQPFSQSAADQLLAELIDEEEGEVIAALRIAVLPAGTHGFDLARAEQLLGSQHLVGAAISDSDAALYSDFHLDADGYGRFLLIDRETNASQMGRAVQRVIEMEVYRMMAMLAFPEARDLARQLDRAERDLAGLVARLDIAPESEEPELLRDLTGLSATIEQISAYSLFRLSAAHAYRNLVRQRGADLRQTRLPRLQTITEFLDRRFEPAMSYCESVGIRLASASERVARASGLLRTRVEFEREHQNQAILADMNRRAAMQLRLQETVEGLSVAAISYYATGLVSYVFRGLSEAGLPIDPTLASGIAVVPIVIGVALALRAARKRLMRNDKPI